MRKLFKDKEFNENMINRLEGRDVDEEIQQRMREFQADELYKAQNYRYCPFCHKLAEKDFQERIAVCSNSFVGGEMQYGCGLQFDWYEADPYQPITYFGNNDYNIQNA